MRLGGLFGPSEAVILVRSSLFVMGLSRGEAAVVSPGCGHRRLVLLRATILAPNRGFGVSRNASRDLRDTT